MIYLWLTIKFQTYYLYFTYFSTFHSFAIHAGDWLRSGIVQAHGLSVTDAAHHLGVTRQAMSNLLNARAGLSADMAIGFEKAFGVEADTLLRMQATYELARPGADGAQGNAIRGRGRPRLPTT